MYLIPDQIAILCILLKKIHGPHQQMGIETVPPDSEGYQNGTPLPVGVPFSTNMIIKEKRVPL